MLDSIDLAVCSGRGVFPARHWLRYHADAVHHGGRGALRGRQGLGLPQGARTPAPRAKEVLVVHLRRRRGGEELCLPEMQSAAPRPSPLSSLRSGTIFEARLGNGGRSSADHVYMNNREGDGFEPGRTARRDSSLGLRPRDVLERPCRELWREISALLEEHRRLSARGAVNAREHARLRLLEGRVARLRQISLRYREAIRRGAR